MNDTFDKSDAARQGHHDDGALVARIARGDQGALAQLIERHGRGLRLFAARYLGNAADAEEIAQDVFMAVWKHAARYDAAKARVSTWLYRIAANRCVDVRRKRTFLAFIGLDDVAEVIASPVQPADARLGLREELAVVRNGVSHLPERQRMALLLRAVGDLDIPAIAEVMRASAGSVEQLLVRARRELRAHIAEKQNGKTLDDKTKETPP